MIIQVNIWICENCYKAVTVTREAETFTDEMLKFPDGIEWPLLGPEAPEMKQICPECAKKLISEGREVIYITKETG